MKAIEPHELRVGNWVLGEDGIPAQIERIIPSTWFIEPPMPIPLTPEILEKAGFKPLVKDWQKKGLIIHTRKRGFVVNKRIPVLQSLHQLQNLYIALTGEELEIKL